MNGRVAAISLCLCLGASVASAQTAAQCNQTLRAVGQDTSRSACNALASHIARFAPSVTRAVAEIQRTPPAKPADVFSQRDLQPRRPQTASLAGSAAQGQAVPSVQPAGLAAGTVASLGTDAGSDAIAAITVNPVVLFLADEVTKKLAQASRFMDLTVFVPVSRTSDDDPATDDEGPRYFGARMRLNFTGLSEGAKVWQRADELTLKFANDRERDRARIRALMARAPSLTDCARALLDTDEDAASIASACGERFTLSASLEEAAALRNALADVRHEADQSYFGADVRYDNGDPTLGAVANAAGRFTYAGIAWGRRFGSADGGTTSGPRARIGMRHAKLDAAATAEFAAEGGFGFELVRRVEEDEINFQGALEFRHGNAPALLTDEFQTNFVMLRGTMQIPVFAGNSLSLNFGLPVRGDVSRVLSVNFNWGLLLPDVVKRR